MTLQEEIKKLPTDEARELLFYAIQELEFKYDCYNCEYADNCNLNFQEPFDVHCRNIIFKHLKERLSLRKRYKRE